MEMEKLEINKKLNAYFIILLFLLGCNPSNNNNNNKVIVKIDSNGDTLSVITYSNDTIKNGLAKYYYKGSGVLMEEIVFKNDKKDGLYKFYYPNQKIEAKAIYKDNMQNGKSYDYSISGNLITEGNWLDDKPIGSFIDYFLNGKVKRYRSFDFEHNLRYVINFDSSGKKINEIGPILGQFLIHSKTDTILINNEFVGQITVATPPGVNSRVFVCEFKGSKMINSTELLTKNGIAEYKTIFKSNGNYKIVTIGQFWNNDTIIKSDTIFTELFVR